ncbi:lysine-2,3-aminomutase-like protein [Elioraea sp.]|uniref:lysine-2,3-aminomutase-like protein n=1 Tax=Elioraea sp. TaxID=2185103 RepID=UPI00307E0B48
MPNGTPMRTIRDVPGLIAAGLVRAGEAVALEQVAARYAIALTPAVAALIDPADPADPIAAQYVPHPDERITAPDEHPDPISDLALSPVKGIVHRYPDRVLLKPLLACPVYCRFCFRREQVGPDGGVLSEAELAAALAYIAARPAIREVILTGGDPLILSPRRLRGILAALEAIPHLESLRIHTRVPVAAPSLVTEALAAALATRKALWVAVHVNHARELAAAARAALTRLVARGIPLLSQSVLLAGVNDSEAALEALCRALIAARVKPHYLHMLDFAPGTARFRVEAERARALHRSLRGRLPGHAIPTLILDIPGGHGKVPAGESHLARGPDGSWRARDPWGEDHAYPPGRPRAQDAPSDRRGGDGNETGRGDTGMPAAPP